MTNIHTIYSKIKNTLDDERNSRQEVYEISSIVESYKDTGCVYVVVHVKGTSNTFQKSIHELYQKKWLECFSKEDVAYIGFLYAAEEAKKISLIEQFPRKKQKVTKSVIFLGMFFSTFLILSNLTAFKVCELQFSHFLWINLGHNVAIDFPAALLLFPLTYFFDDTLTEVYGFKMSRLIIWGGLISNVIFTLCTWSLVYVPASPTWDIASKHGQDAYSFVFKGSWQVFLASAVGYFCGEFLNSTILARLKVLTSGKKFFLRVIGSTAIGAGVDSIIFCNIAFWHILPTSMIWGIVLTQYIFKMSYETMMFPITYLLTAFLKKVDQVDHYDFKTKFNPFSVSLED